MTIAHLAVGRFPIPSINESEIQDLFEKDPEGYNARVNPYPGEFNVNI
jgi:hypothetical protein